MALLSVEDRKKRFEYLGYEYTKDGIKALQKRYFSRKQDIDGVYGRDTDRLLRHVYNVKKNTKNFKPEEFKCECGGRYCTGYPSWMKKVELQNLQTIRDHYGKQMKITCGLRCKPYNNSLPGSIRNSKHLTGYAADFYMEGVTDSLEHRKAAVLFIRKLPNHHYTYGNGINSNGYKVSAPYMGNALHTDTSAAVKTTVKKTAAKASAKKKTKAKNAKAEKIVAAAKKFCWPYGTKTSKKSYSKGKALKTYVKALKKYCKKKAKISQTDCGYFINTCARAAGLGKSFDALPDKGSQPYPKLPDTVKVVLQGKWIPDGFLEPGDMITYKKKNGGQHTLMYYAKGKIAEANRGHFFPSIKKDKEKYNGSNVKKETLRVIRAK